MYCSDSEACRERVDRSSPSKDRHRFLQDRVAGSSEPWSLGIFGLESLSHRSQKWLSPRKAPNKPGPASVTETLETRASSGLPAFPSQEIHVASRRCTHSETCRIEAAAPTDSN